MYSLNDINEYAKKLGIPEEFIPRDKFSPLKVNIQLFGSAGRNGYPDICIKLNNDVLFEGTIIETQSLSFTSDIRRNRNLFSIEFKNKLDDDTVVENGVITKDKYLHIDRLEFNEIPLDPLKFFRYEPVYPNGYLEYDPNPSKVIYNSRLSFTGKISIYIESPVGLFLSRKYFANNNFLANKAELTVTNFKKLADFYTKLAHKD
jgi:hypothetical protein